MLLLFENICLSSPNAGGPLCIFRFHSAIPFVNRIRTPAALLLAAPLFFPLRLTAFLLSALILSSLGGFCLLTSSALLLAAILPLSLNGFLGFFPGPSGPGTQRSVLNLSLRLFFLRFVCLLPTLLFFPRCSNALLLAALSFFLFGCFRCRPGLTTDCGPCFIFRRPPKAEKQQHHAQQQEWQPVGVQRGIAGYKHGRPEQRDGSTRGSGEDLRNLSDHICHPVSVSDTFICVYQGSRSDRPVRFVFFSIWLQQREDGSGHAGRRIVECMQQFCVLVRNNRIRIDSATKQIIGSTAKNITESVDSGRVKIPKANLVIGNSGPLYV